MDQEMKQVLMEMQQKMGTELSNMKAELSELRREVELLRGGADAASKATLISRTNISEEEIEKYMWIKPFDDLEYTMNRMSVKFDKGAKQLEDKIVLMRQLLEEKLEASKGR